MESIDYTSKLNDYVQKFDHKVEYEDLGSEGPGHIKTFTQRVIFNGKPYQEGVGKNKREARQNAAKHALESVLPTASNHSHVSGRSVRDATETILLAKLTDPNYRYWINFCIQKNWVPRTRSRSAGELEGHAIPVVSGGKEHPEVKRKTTTEAKQWLAKGSWKSAKSEEDGTSNIATSDVASSASDSWNNSSALPQEEKLGSKAKIKLGEKFNKEPSNTRRDPTTSSRFLTEYDNIKCIGKGGFGHVYKARRKFMETYCAVKIVPYEEKALREAVVLADLQHSNIVRYFTSWMDDQENMPPNSDGSSTSQSSSDTSGPYLYIEMELCEMKTLKVWIDEKNLFPKVPHRRKESLDIMKKMICGVEYIHSKNLMHRDLKPSNIMVGSDGGVKIVDFGLVTKESDEAGNVLEKTMDRGTTIYMPPEQRDNNVYNNKVDIFASGLVYFLMLWNISSHEMSKCWKDIRKKKLPAAFSWSFLIEALLIKSMLHENPESRPSAKEIKAKLEGLDNARPARTTSDEPRKFVTPKPEGGGEIWSRFI